ncbi:MAG: Na/Pi cotransporter family protein [Rhodobacteraceae bacterium]|nr:MAG: Na/Pi cotransporter family protein [Paracoccaceae bacterium]
MTTLFALAGGIGIFLLGMEMMTAALREQAGPGLRGLLARSTTTPLRGVMTGAATTAVIQSSSATTVMTVGFVGAGLIPMTHALGVIYGANIGTTMTGWLVSILGFKLNLGAFAALLLLPASLGVLLAKGQTARIGRAVAGLCLLLVGLDLMQEGASGLGAHVTPDDLPGTGAFGLIALAGIGLALTVAMQSSSAAVALALVMLQGGALTLVQGAAIVVGMNVGTTFTALLASVGGSRPMRQVAVANLLFNLVVSGLALPLLWLFADRLTGLGGLTDAATALLLFHTGFNLVGTTIFLPLTDRFAALVARLVPEIRQPGLVSLDRSALGDVDTALLTAQTAVDAIAARLFSALGAGMCTPPDYRALAALAPVAAALDDLRAFMADLHIPADRDRAREGFAALLHQVDHLSRMLARTGQTAHIDSLLDDRILRRGSLAAGACLRRLGDNPTPREEARIARIMRHLDHRRDRHRRGLLLGEHAGLYSLPEVFAHTDAMRWLGRILHHAERVVFYRQQTRQALPAASQA